MTATQIIILSAITLYAFAMVVMGIMASRNQTHEGFIIGSRNVGLIPTIGSQATAMRDGMGIIFWFGFGAATGYGGLWMFIGVIFAFIIIALIGPKIRATANSENYITIGEMIRAHTGPFTEKITALLVLQFAIMMIAVQLFVAGNVFATVLGMEPWVGIFSVAGIVGFYLYFGGYSTVVKTDAIQFFLIISLIAIPFFFPPPLESVTNFSSLLSLGTDTSIGLFGIGVGFALSAGDTWQRVFSARDDGVIRKGFPLAGAFLIIMTLSLIYLGMASAPFLGETIKDENAFYMIFSGDFISPPLLAFIGVIVMAICMSTMDSYCYLSASTIAKNFMPKKMTEGRAEYIRFSRIVMMAIIASMSVVALGISDVVLFVFKAASLLFVLAPIFFFSAISTKDSKSQRSDVFMSLAAILSSIIYFYMFSQNMLENPLYVMAPVVVSAVLSSIAFVISRSANA